MAITTTYNYTAGTDNGDWSDEANAWDGDTSTYASVTCNNNTSDDWIKGTANNTPTSGSAIQKVEVGVSINQSGYFTGSNYDHCVIIPVFNGSTNGSNYDIYTTTTQEDKFVDITNDSNAPSTWSWSDVNNLDFLIYYNDGSSSYTNQNVYEMYVRVTYLSDDDINEITEKFHVLKETNGQNTDIKSDDFNDNSFDTSKWWVNTLLDGYVTEANQELELASNNDDSDSKLYLSNGSATDDDYVVVVKITDINITRATDGSGFDGYFTFGDDYNNTGSYYFYMSDTLFSSNVTNNVPIVQPSTPFWLKISRLTNNGQTDLTHEYSTDNSTWTSFGTIENIDNTENDQIVFIVETTETHSTEQPYYTSGTDQGDNGNAWSNLSNMLDGDDSTYASASTKTNTVLLTVNNNTRNTGTISKVKVVIKMDVNYGTGYITPIFNGSTDGSSYNTTNQHPSDHIYYFDITNDSNAPSAWSWTDINNLDMKFYVDKRFFNETVNVYFVSIEVQYDSILHDNKVTIDDFTSESFTTQDTSHITIYEDKTTIGGNDTMSDYMMIMVDSNTRYIQLSDNLSHSDMSHFRIRKGGTTFGALKKFDIND